MPTNVDGSLERIQEISRMHSRDLVDTSPSTFVCVSFVHLRLIHPSTSHSWISMSWMHLHLRLSKNRQTKDLYTLKSDQYTLKRGLYIEAKETYIHPEETNKLGSLWRGTKETYVTKKWLECIYIHVRLHFLVHLRLIHPSVYNVYASRTIYTNRDTFPQ